MDKAGAQTVLKVLFVNAVKFLFYYFTVSDTLYNTKQC